MPIQIIPAPNVPDPMQQMGQMYEMFNMMQQAPLKKQLLEAQIAGQAADERRADRQLSIAEQDAANRQAAAGREEKQFQRVEEIQAAKGGQMNTLLDEAVRIGKLTPERAAAAKAVANLGDPTLLPPEAQALHFNWQLQANPQLALQFQQDQKQLRELDLRIQEAGLRIQKLNTQGGTSEDVKDTVNMFNTFADQLRADENDASNAKIEASDAGAQKRAEARWAKDHPGRPAYKTNRRGEAIKDANGKPQPEPDFAGYLGAEMADASTYAAKAKAAEERRAATYGAMSKLVPELANFFPKNFGNGPAVTQPTATQLMAATLATVRAKNGDAAAATIAAQKGLRAGPLFDASFETAFPPEPGEDQAQREALKSQIKAALEYQPPAGTPANAGAAAGVRSP